VGAPGLDAVAQAHGRAVRFEGQMVDLPLLERAQRISARRRRIEASINELKRAQQ
jgi:citrate lyase beta subunit